MKRLKESFGPVVIHEDDEFRASCAWCVFRSRWPERTEVCRHVSPERPIPDIENTPDWCEMREDMLRDATEMARQEGAP